MNNNRSQHNANKKLAWPSSLKTALKMHLKTVQTEQKMPLIEDNPPNSVYNIIMRVADSLPKAPPITSISAVRTEETSTAATSASADGTENTIANESVVKVKIEEPSSTPAAAPAGLYCPDTIATLSDFLLDLFEQCCMCNLLSLEERRTFQFVTVGKQTANGRPPAIKKKRTEVDVSLVPVPQRLTYSSVLTAEYLLRLLAALPILVHHYRVLCSGITSNNPTSHPVNQQRSVLTTLSQPITSASSASQLAVQPDGTASSSPAASTAGGGGGGAGGNGNGDSHSASTQQQLPQKGQQQDGLDALWFFGNAILKYLERNPTILTPLSKYAALVDE